MARPLRRVSGAPAGAIDSSVTSPPRDSVSLRAASRAYSSLPLMTAGVAVRTSRPSGPSRSPPEAGSGTGLVRTTMRTRLLPSAILAPRGGLLEAGRRLACAPEQRPGHDEPL